LGLGLVGGLILASTLFAKDLGMFADKGLPVIEVIENNVEAPPRHMITKAELDSRKAKAIVEKLRAVLPFVIELLHLSEYGTGGISPQAIRSLVEICSFVGCVFGDDADELLLGVWINGLNAHIRQPEDNGLLGQKDLLKYSKLGPAMILIQFICQSQ
jgi:hypothetical protein